MPFEVLQKQSMRDLRQSFSFLVYTIYTIYNELPLQTTLSLTSA